MKVIRNGVFETNSSSTHSFVTQYADYEVQPVIEPDWSGEFGWQFEFWHSSGEKLAYICRCLLTYEDEQTDEGIYNRLKPLKDRLENCGTTFEIPTAEELDRHWGYVDHGNEYLEEVLDIIKTDDDLLSFLFNPNNGIEGGNDNC